MKSNAPNFLDAIPALRAIEDGSLSSESLVRACLERIADRDPQVLAFAAIDIDRSLAQARETDGSAARGRLRGLPFAAKDVLDTADFVTSYGSPIYAGHRPAADAACVAAAKEAGAILLGKTATCEFATLTPCATRNPHDLQRTPGGSSSGSAAAVADYMVPVAFGTQTSASTIRPAAYCGVVGYKPSFGLINSSGLKHASPGLDTISVFTRSIADARYFIHGRVTDAPFENPRIALCLSRQWDDARPETVNALNAFCKILERAGARVSTVHLPARLEATIALQGRLSAYEARQSLTHERATHYQMLSPRLQARVESEKNMSTAEYLEIMRQVSAARQEATELFRDADALLYPAADGEAELGMETGSPRFGGLWTLLHLPALSLPIGSGPAGLPLGAQLIGSAADDLRLLAVAAFAERALRS